MSALPVFRRAHNRWLPALVPAAVLAMGLATSTPAVAATHAPTVRPNVAASPVDVDTPYVMRGIVFGKYHWCYLTGIPAVASLRMDGNVKQHTSVMGSFSCSSPTTGLLYYACPGCRFLVYETTSAIRVTC